VRRAAARGRRGSMKVWRPSVEAVAGLEADTSARQLTPSQRAVGPHSRVRVPATAVRAMPVMSAILGNRDQRIQAKSARLARAARWDDA
jgi:hypothetical protein